MKAKLGITKKPTTKGITPVKLGVPHRTGRVANKKK